MRAMMAVIGAIGALAVAGCAGASSSGGGSGAAAAPGSSAVAGKVVLGALPAHTSGRAGGADAQDVFLSKVRVPKLPSTIIKTGRLSIRLPHGSAADTVGLADHIAGDYGGYVLSSQTTTRKPQRATIVIRVPAAYFTPLMGKLATLGGGTVLSEQITGEDVGQEFVDLGARERNLRAQSRALVRLMKQAVTIADTIKIQNELFDIQGQIEDIEGRLRYLHDQADMSTITVNVSVGKQAHHHPGQPTAIGSAFRSGWHRAVAVVTAVIAGAGLVIPVALLALIALAAAWKVWPPLRRRVAAAAADTAASE